MHFSQRALTVPVLNSTTNFFSYFPMYMSACIFHPIRVCRETKMMLLNSEGVSTRKLLRRLLTKWHLQRES